MQCLVTAALIVLSIFLTAQLKPIFQDLRSRSSLFISVIWTEFLIERNFSCASFSTHAQLRVKHEITEVDRDGLVYIIKTTEEYSFGSAFKKMTNQIKNKAARHRIYNKLT